MSQQCERVIIFVFSALLLAGVSLAQSPTGLVVESEVVRTSYCLTEVSGVRNVLSVKITLRLSYRNTSNGAVILPRLTQIRQYTLYSIGLPSSVNREERLIRFKPFEMFDGDKLDEYRPDPEFFDVLEPNSSGVSRQDEVDIVVGASSFGESLPTGDRMLSVEIDHWPANPESLPRLQSRWDKYGTLWSKPIVVGPVKIHIDAGTPAKGCPGVM